jgi:hypothetical protein
MAMGWRSRSLRLSVELPLVVVGLQHGVLRRPADASRRRFVVPYQQGGSFAFGGASMRHAHALLGSSLASALVLSACSNDPIAPPASVRLHVTPVCDFVTFGRLVADGIVISGNAGGNAPGGGILGEIEIRLTDETIHAHIINLYAIPLDGPFGGDAEARVVGAEGVGGEDITLRLVDNGEPGKNTDQVYLRIDGNVILGPQTIDRGNIQLHLKCRGPGD